MRHVWVGHQLTSQIVGPPQLPRRRSEQRATVLSHPPPTVQWGGEERVPVLRGQRKEAASLWGVSSPSGVVTGLEAIVDRWMMERWVLRGQRWGLEQARPA